MMTREDLKEGVVYLHDGTCGADGGNIIFSVIKDGSFKYHLDGCITLHWSGNKYNNRKGFCINEGHLKNVTKASTKTANYYKKCVKAGKDVGGFSWHDSNDEKRK